jgi:hypothetical protein
MGNLQEDLFTYMIMYRSFIVIMKNISNKFVEKIKIFFMFNNVFQQP